MIKPQQLLDYTAGSESLQADEHTPVWMVWHSVPEAQKLCKDLQDLALRTSSSGCSSVSFMTTFVISQKMEVFPWTLWAIIKPEKGMWKPLVCSQVGQKQEVLFAFKGITMF